MNRTIVSLCLVIWALGASMAAGADRPNIVWILSEDSSKHYFRHFDPDGVSTPSIESLAASGVTFDRAFSNAPVCSVARTTLLTGCYGPRIGTQFHRANVRVPVPGGLTLFPARLRAAGYYTTNNSKEDYNVVKDAEVWDDSSKRATWRARPTAETPFFHVQTITLSHESSLHFPESDFTDSQSDLDAIKVPAYLPDTPLIRYTKARYQERIQAVDKQVGELVEKLRADGLLESTFIIYCGDHGGVLPRSKGYLFETGLHVPLVVRIPEKFAELSPFAAGSRTQGFVEFVDFAATTLSLAGLSPSPQADGQSFLGAGVTADQVAARNETFGYADRFDEKYETVRSLRVGNYKYIRSFEPFSPDGLHNAYRYEMFAYRHWRDQFHAGKLNEIQRAFFLPKPAERLYDLASDPDESKNLADKPELANILVSLRNRLTERLKGMPDLSMYPEAFLIREAFDDPVAFGQSHRQAIAELIDIANLGLEQDSRSDPQGRLQQALQSSDPWQRYRAAIVCAGLPAIDGDLREALAKLLDDPEPLVAVRAAQALAIVAAVDPRPAILKAIGRATEATEALEMLNCVVQLNDRPESAHRFQAQDVIAAMPFAAQGELKRRIEYLPDAANE
ncbi:MAG: sulfatase-like hydrolase/transferase [Planctomycetaceae bacterium]